MPELLPDLMAVLQFALVLIMIPTSIVCIAFMIRIFCPAVPLIDMVSYNIGFSAFLTFFLCVGCVAFIEVEKQSFDAPLPPISPDPQPLAAWSSHALLVVLLVLFAIAAVAVVVMYHRNPWRSLQSTESDIPEPDLPPSPRLSQTAPEPLVCPSCNGIMPYDKDTRYCIHCRYELPVTGATVQLRKDSWYE